MKIKDAKISFLADVALGLFLEKSINDVTIKDIALAAGLGEATVYRYFSHKKNVVEMAAEKLQKKVFAQHFGVPTGKNGYEKLENFFDAYLKVFSSDSEYFKFVRQFDAFMIAEGGTSEEYSIGIELFKNTFLSAYREGLKDGSVRDCGSEELLYFTTAHAMLELCKKLSLGENIVKQDETTDAVAEISKLKEIILFYLAPRRA